MNTCKCTENLFCPQCYWKTVEEVRSASFQRGMVVGIDEGKSRLLSFIKKIVIIVLILVAIVVIL